MGRAITPQVADILVVVWELGLFLSLTRYGLMNLNPANASDRILSTMTDALMLLDAYGTLRLANRSSTDLLEIPENELIGTPLESYVLEKTSMHSFLQETLSSGKSLNREFTFISQSGKSILTQVSASEISDNMQTTLGFVVVARDITEQKKIEEAIRDSERRFRELAELLPILIFESDLQGKVTFINNIATKIFEVKHQELLGSNIFDFIAPEDRKRCQSNVRSILRGENIKVMSTLELPALARDFPS